MKLPSIIPPGSFELFEELAKLNPPRCLGPDENVIEHHRYAAVVQLIETVRAKLTAAEARAQKQRSP